MVSGIRTGAVLFLVFGLAAWALAEAPATAEPPLPKYFLTTGMNTECTAEDVALVLFVEGEKNLTTFGVELTYDPAKISFVAAVPGSAVSTAGWELTGANEPQPGRLLVAGAALSGVPLDGDAELFILYFDCKPEACPAVADIAMQPIRGRSGPAEYAGNRIVCGAFPVLTLPVVTAICPDEEIVVPVIATRMPAAPAPLQFDLAYNPAELTFVRIENGAAATADGHEAGPGILRLSATPSQPDGELLRMVFTSAACPATTTLTLHNAQPPIADLLLYGGTVVLK